VHYAGAGPDTATTDFEVSVRDENPDHAAASGTVTIEVYRPSSSFADATLAAAAIAGAPLDGFAGVEEQRVISYLLSKEAGYVVWDGSGTEGTQAIAAPSAHVSAEGYESGYLPSFGKDSSHLLQGGAGPDSLAGGMEADRLIGGGGDDALSGGGGPDRFVVLSIEDGNDTILDFSSEDGDVIDLARVLEGDSEILSDYVQIEAGDEEAILTVDTNGDGSGYTDLRISLAGVSAADTDLYALVAGGHLAVGDLYLVPRVSLAVAKDPASENGPENGEFLLTRVGGHGSELVVNLLIAGSAQNGVDYATIEGRAVFAAGEDTTRVVVEPHQDSLAEPAESVEVVVADGDGYLLGGASRASLLIEDLKPVLSIEVLEPLAERNTGSPAQLLVRREGLLDRSLFLRLEAAGSAASGADYTGVPKHLNLANGQTTQLIEVRPLGGEGAKALRLSVVPDAAYRLAENASAEVHIVDAAMTFAQWRAANHPDATPDLQALAGMTDPSTGRSYLSLYAFGSDLPKYQVLDGYLSVSFKPNPSLRDLVYQVKCSSSLPEWHSGPDAVVRVEPAAESLESGRVSYRTAHPLAEAPSQFLQVDLEYLP
jgi:hypothetical protein